MKGILQLAAWLAVVAGSFFGQPADASERPKFVWILSEDNYRYRMLAYQQWRTLYYEGKLNAKQRRFFEPKAVEALYDLEQDPHEVNNLATDPAYAELLKDLRARLRQRVVELPDLSLLPLAEAQPKLQQAMESSDPWERYWALIAGSCFGGQAEPLVPAARKRLEDPQPLVRVRAAELLGIVGAADPRPTLYEVLNTTLSPLVALLTLNTAVFFHDRSPGGYRFDLESLDMPIRSGEVERRVEYLSSSHLQHE